MSLDIKKVVEDLTLKYGVKDPFLICKRLGYKIRWKNYNINWKGQIIKSSNDNVLIYINKNLGIQSKYLVCAHELGHALLHHDAGNNFDGGNTLNKITMERQANMFAAYLLLSDKEHEYDLKFENMNGYLIKNVIDDYMD